MTKFEEEVKPIATVEMKATGDGNEINFHCKTGLSDYLLSKGNADLYLKSQLQQQALPVVPEFVAGAIESLPDHYSAFEAISLINAKVNTLPEENEDWLPVYNWLCEGIGNQNIFALAFITGKYEVEKPQLFYLKHIDMSKRNSINDLYLKKYIHADLTENGEHRLSHAMSAKGIYPSKEYCAFTQQEIDSMHAESYELVPVEDGE